MCHKQYIGEIERTLGKGFKEHTNGNNPSVAVQKHINLTGHLVTFDLVKMLYKEDKTRRKVRRKL